MLKGKKLYGAARTFTEKTLVPGIDDKDMSDEQTTAVLQDGATLGLALVIDIAESLNKIATYYG